MRTTSLACLVALAVLAQAALAGGCAGSPGVLVREVVVSPSGKRVGIYAADTFRPSERAQVSAEVMTRAMRASGSFSEEDVRSLAGSLAGAVGQLEPDQRVIVTGAGKVLHVFARGGELVIVNYHDGHEVSRHAAALPRTDLAAVETSPPSSPAETRPTPAETRPTPAETRPTPVETRPTPAETRPTPAETRPTPAETRPTPVEPRPTPAETRPAPVEPRPAPVEPRPAPVEPRPDPRPVTPTPAPTPAPIPVEKPPTPPAEGPRPKRPKKPKEAASPRPRLSEAEVRAKLKELDRLHQKGLITDDEYQKKRKQLLDQL